MSMTISTGDDADELDDDLPTGGERDTDDDDDRPARRPAADADPVDDDDEDDDRSPEDLRTEIKKLRSALEKANSSGQRRRQQLKELRAATSALNAAGDDGEDDEPADDEDEKAAAKKADPRTTKRAIERAVKRREAELRAEHDRDIIDTRAESALVSAGADAKAIRLLKRELDYEDLELLKDRSVDGLEEEIDRLKTEFPNLFRSGKGQRRRINGGDDRDRGTARGRKMTATELQVASLRGGGGR